MVRINDLQLLGGQKNADFAQVEQLLKIDLKDGFLLFRELFGAEKIGIEHILADLIG
jgi:hypothetical protein